MVEDHNRNVINEAYRVVRTNLDFMIGANKSEAIMATSLYPAAEKRLHLSISPPQWR